MDSRFDPFIRNLPRHTETADSWMGIRRHEQDSQEKKHSEGRKDKEEAVWEDVTSVSLGALRLFLEGLVAAQSAPDASTSVTPPLHTPAGDAAHAYQATASRYHAPPTPAPAASAPALNTEEQRTIHRILEGLSSLQDRGMQSLTIVKGGTFLQSVQESVSRALAG